MASIVKELDKVTGTTTRSHNIADAVSKLKTGGGADIVVVDASGTNMSSSDVEKAMTAWDNNSPVFAKFPDSHLCGRLSEVSTSLGGITMSFDNITIDYLTLIRTEVTVGTQNDGYPISSSTQRYNLTAVAND